MASSHSASRRGVASTGTSPERAATAVSAPVTTSVISARRPGSVGTGPHHKTARWGRPTASGSGPRTGPRPAVQCGARRSPSHRLHRRTQVHSSHPGVTLGGSAHDRRVRHPPDAAGGLAQRRRLRRGVRGGRALDRRRARGPPGRGPGHRARPGRRHPGGGGRDHRLRAHRRPAARRACAGRPRRPPRWRPAPAAAVSPLDDLPVAAAIPPGSGCRPVGACATRPPSPRPRRWRCWPGPTTRPAPPGSRATTPAPSVTPSCRSRPATPTPGGGCWSPTAPAC